ncbi:hypothetical protein [Streptomyces cellulosae]|uniref:Uncharacterized protein n=1 Tax=Streptomyces cellulosae TaxID=1968 RepID=A0ABW7YFZ0_STRCE|nr:hypothetical protein [Streptomyces cellulosae]
MKPERFHLTLASAGHPVMQGWWGNEATPRRMISVWLGNWSALPGARVTLVDEETGETLTSWPDETQGSAILAP